jgi:predicted secreted Zn-dependent protease
MFSDSELRHIEEGLARLRMELRELDTDEMQVRKRSEDSIERLRRDLEREIDRLKRQKQEKQREIDRQEQARTSRQSALEKEAQQESRRK